MHPAHRQQLCPVPPSPPLGAPLRLEAPPGSNTSAEVEVESPYPESLEVILLTLFLKGHSETTLLLELKEVLAGRVGEEA